jgi:lysophospholipase L1-like esterase
MGWAAHLACEQPRENCRSTRYAMAHLSEWTKNRHYDVIVFNFGIWDAKQPRTPLDEYKRNLNSIIDCLRADRLYFCTTTPGRVNERHEVSLQDVERYNRAALEVMRERGVKVIDLHALCLKHREWWYPENVHYTDEGYKQMAEYVKRAIH